MPFPRLILLKIIPSNSFNVKQDTCRKEGGFVLSHKRLSCHAEKASVSASERKDYQAASVTVEAVFCIPLFFYAAVCLIWMLEIRAVQISVRCGMQETGKKMAVEVHDVPVLIPSRVETGIVNAVGSERLNQSLVIGGSNGLHCEKSYMIPGSGIMELKVSYKIRLPFAVFAVPPLAYQESMRVKGWNGYVKQGFAEPTDKTIVYITETGVVYHKDYHCTYLEPSIRMVPAESLEGLRNENKEKYYPCERCLRGASASGAVYISDYGNRYHSTLTCGGIKRRIYAVPVSEVKGKGACSKCGK